MRPRSRTTQRTGDGGQGTKRPDLCPLTSVLWTFSSIDGETVDGIERLAHRFIQGWMRVNRMHQRLDGGFGFHRQHAFADQLERFRPDDVYAQNFAVGFIRDDLHESIVLAENTGLAVSEERELADLYLAALRARLRLGQSHAADAWIGISGAWNPIPVDGRHGFSGDMSDRDHPLGR